MTINHYRWKAEDEDEATRTCREAFEAWAPSEGLDLSWEPVAYSKFYKNKITRIVWRAWRAAPLRSGVV